MTLFDILPDLLIPINLLRILWAIRDGDELMVTYQSMRS